MWYSVYLPDINISFKMGNLIPRKMVFLVQSLVKPFLGLLGQGTGQALQLVVSKVRDSHNDGTMLPRNLILIEFLRLKVSTMNRQRQTDGGFR